MFLSFQLLLTIFGFIILITKIFHVSFTVESVHIVIHSINVPAVEVYVSKIV
jgi:hypothetical protein